MHRTFSLFAATGLISLLYGAGAGAQTPAGPAPLAPSAPAALPDSAAPADAERGDGISSAGSAFTPGFEAGLRAGIGLPVGKAGNSALGQERKLGDLVAWRTPVWVDVGYHVSPAASYGLYGQIGFGGSGDVCNGKCDWADLRLGLQGQWRINAGQDAEPWLGLGVGIEALNLQDSEIQTDEDGIPFTVRTRERLLGPELLLQAGLALRVDRWLQLGPYVSGSLGTYLGDKYECYQERPVGCPSGSSVDGSAFHAWLGVGLSGRYSP